MLHLASSAEAGPSRLPIQQPTAYGRFPNEARNRWIDDLLSTIQKGLHPPDSPGPSRSPSPIEDEVELEGDGHATEDEVAEPLEVEVEDDAASPSLGGQEQYEEVDDVFEAAMQEPALPSTEADTSLPQEFVAAPAVPLVPPTELEAAEPDMAIDPDLLAAVISSAQSGLPLYPADDEDEVLDEGDNEPYESYALEEVADQRDFDEHIPEPLGIQADEEVDVDEVQEEYEGDTRGVDLQVDGQYDQDEYEEDDEEAEEEEEEEEENDPAAYRVDGLDANGAIEILDSDDEDEEDEDEDEDEDAEEETATEEEEEEEEGYDEDLEAEVQRRVPLRRQRSYDDDEEEEAEEEEEELQGVPQQRVGSEDYASEDEESDINEEEEEDEEIAGPVDADDDDEDLRQPPFTVKAHEEDEIDEEEEPVESNRADRFEVPVLERAGAEHPTLTAERPHMLPSAASMDTLGVPSLPAEVSMIDPALLAPHFEDELHYSDPLEPDHMQVDEDELETEPAVFSGYTTVDIEEVEEPSDIPMFSRGPSVETPGVLSGFRSSPHLPMEDLIEETAFEPLAFNPATIFAPAVTDEALPLMAESVMAAQLGNTPYLHQEEVDLSTSSPSGAELLPEIREYIDAAQDALAQPSEPGTDGVSEEDVDEAPMEETDVVDPFNPAESAAMSEVIDEFGNEEPAPAVSMAEDLEPPVFSKLPADESMADQGPTFVVSSFDVVAVNDVGQLPDPQAAPPDNSMPLPILLHRPQLDRSPSLVVEPPSHPKRMDSTDFAQPQETREPTPVEFPGPQEAPPPSDLPVPIEAGDMVGLVRESSPSMIAEAPQEDPRPEDVLPVPFREETPISMPDPADPPPDAVLEAPLSPHDPFHDQTPTPSVIAQAPAEDPRPDEVVVAPPREETPVSLPDPSVPPPDAVMQSPFSPHRLAPQETTPTASLNVEPPADEPVFVGLETTSREESPTPLPVPGVAPVDTDRVMPEVPHDDQPQEARSPSLVVEAADDVPALPMVEDGPPDAEVRQSREVTSPSPLLQEGSETPMEMEDILAATAPMRLRHHHGLPSVTPEPSTREVPGLLELPAPNTRVTRSHCFYEKLRVAEDGVSAVILVPQCTVAEVDKLKEEDCEVEGEPTADEEQEARHRIISEDSPLLRAELAHKIHRVVGHTILSEGHCYLLYATDDAMASADPPRSASPRKTPRRSIRALTPPADDAEDGNVMESSRQGETDPTEIPATPAPQSARRGRGRKTDPQTPSREPVRLEPGSAEPVHITRAAAKQMERSASVASAPEAASLNSPGIGLMFANGPPASGTRAKTAEPSDRVHSAATDDTGSSPEVINAVGGRRRRQSLRSARPAQATADGAESDATERNLRSPLAGHRQPRRSTRLAAESSETPLDTAEEATLSTVDTASSSVNEAQGAEIQPEAPFALEFDSGAAHETSAVLSATDEVIEPDTKEVEAGGHGHETDPETTPKPKRSARLAKRQAITPPPAEAGPHALTSMDGIETASTVSSTNLDTPRRRSTRKLASATLKDGDDHPAILAPSESEDTVSAMSPTQQRRGGRSALLERDDAAYRPDEDEIVVELEEEAVAMEMTPQPEDDESQLEVGVSTRSRKRKQRDSTLIAATDASPETTDSPTTAGKSAKARSKRRAVDAGDEVDVAAPEVEEDVTVKLSEQVGTEQPSAKKRRGRAKKEGASPQPRSTAERRNWATRLWPFGRGAQPGADR